MSRGTRNTHKHKQSLTLKTGMPTGDTRSWWLLRNDDIGQGGQGAWSSTNDRMVKVRDHRQTIPSKGFKRYVVIDNRYHGYDGQGTWSSTIIDTIDRMDKIRGHRHHHHRRRQTNHLIRVTDFYDQGRWCEMKHVGGKVIVLALVSTIKQGQKKGKKITKVGTGSNQTFS